MAAKEISIQPRRQPPKTADLQNEQAIIQSKAMQSAALAADAKPLDIIEGNFEDVQTVFHGAAPAGPSQEELTSRALANLPKDNGSPVAHLAQIGPGVNPAQTLVLAPVQDPTPKPPSTVSELKMQHSRPDNERFPDVADIFQGRVPNEKPAGGAIVIPKPQETQVIRKEVVITHEIIDPNQAMMCLKECDVYIRDTMVHFTRDQLVTDFSQIDAIRRSDNPNFAPYGELDTMEKCPHCHNRFPGRNSTVKYGS